MGTSGYSQHAIEVRKIVSNLIKIQSNFLSISRYARTQFVDPNKDCEDWEKEVKFYEDSEESEEDDKKGKAPMDPDHRLLLKSAKPLLQSRNAAVVMATAQLYYHCAPRPEVVIFFPLSSRNAKKSARRSKLWPKP